MLEKAAVVSAFDELGYGNSSVNTGMEMAIPMARGKHKHPNIKRIELKAPEARAFLKRVKDRALIEQDYEIIESMAETIQVLSQAVEDKAASIKRLVRYLFGAPTETAENLFAKTAPQPEKTEKPRPRGHGRNGAAGYTGGAHVKVPHPTLKPGDICPLCIRGKVYKLALPSTVVRILGGAPLQSTVFELCRLRCNSCGEIFTAPAPEEAQGQKYDESAAAMIAILKYGCGMPFYRLEKLQKAVGMPVPASTQWAVLDESSKPLEPVFEALLQEAAQGRLVHNDDTTAKILEYINQPGPDEKRTGTFTTGVVSIKDDRRIALFMTGRQHAGENLEDVLRARVSGLPPPIQMCDALSRNIPKELATILSNCLDHARRQFVDIVESFPEECRHVIELLGKVYHNDALARQGALSPEDRLTFHRRESGPVMDELQSWCRQQFDQHLVEPNSGLGKAINYLLNHWRELTLFLRMAGAPLSNSICERALKLAVLHRKNALFFKTQRGAHVGDLFMSLIHTCQLAGENPFEYLTQLFRNALKVAKSPAKWLPWSYREMLQAN